MARTIRRPLAQAEFEQYACLVYQHSRHSDQGMTLRELLGELWPLLKKNWAGEVMVPCSSKLFRSPPPEEVSDGAPN